MELEPIDRTIISDEMVQAVDKIRDTYLVFNGLGYPFDRELRADDPMTLLATAGRAALARMPGVTTEGALAIWEEMGSNGENARWNINLWLAGVI